MTLENLIKKYEQLLEEHESGIMMSMREAIAGEVWCNTILKDLRAMRG